MSEGTSKRKVQIDERLFERILQNDQEAFRELYERSYRPLYAFLLSYTQNSEDAQDLLQETYVQIYKNIHMYKSQGNPMAWMMKIAKNMFLMKYRKEKKSQSVSYEDIENELGFGDMSNVENRMILEKMFEFLTIDERNLIIMHDVGGLKHREIAKALEWPLGTVVSRYNKCIRKLKKEFLERQLV